MVSFRQKKYKLEDISISQKHEMFNGLNFKRWKQKKNVILSYHLKFDKILDRESAKNIRK